MPEGNTPSTSGSKKTWYIIGAIAIVLVLAWIGMRAVPSMMLAREGVRMDGAPGGATTYSDDKGNTVTVGGTSMPDNWPSDAPQNYAGASITYSGTSNPQTGKAGSAVVYSVGASVQDVIGYYKQQLDASGWTVVSSANMGQATVLSATKGTRSFGAYIVDGGDRGVTVTVGISDK